MPKLRQLSPNLAERIKELFPAQAEHMDLVFAFQSWGKQDIELTPEQIIKTLSAIQQHAIPRTQALAWRQTHPELRQDLEMTVNDWKILAAMLAAAIK